MVLRPPAIETCNRVAGSAVNDRTSVQIVLAAASLSMSLLISASDFPSVPAIT